MNTILLKRLVWKEYRLLRPAWLALFGIGVGLELFFLAIHWIDQADTVEPGWKPWIWGLVWLMSVMNLIAAWAITFADEREKGTTDWLVMLSASPWATLLAKFGFTLISTASFAALFALTALMIVGPLSADDWRENGSMLFPTACGTVVFGAMGALLSRRALWSVLAMAFWWFVMAAPSAIWFSNDVNEAVFSRKIYVCESLAFVPVVGWLAWRWCGGRYYDADLAWVKVARIREKAYRVVGREAIEISRLPKQTESGRHWQRVWQRLLWHERHREWLHKPLLVLCGFAVLFAQTGTFWAGFMAVWYLFLIPTLIGVLAFRSDDGQSPGFLGQRAVSPFAVWWAKQFVWLPRAFAIPLWIWLGAVVAECAGFRWTPVPEWVRSLTVRESSTEAALNAGDLPFSLLALVVLNYALGQFFGFVGRNSLMAALVGVIANLVTGYSLAGTVMLGIPLSLSVGPLIVGLFWLTARGGAGWMIEKPPDLLRQVVAAAAIVFISLSLIVIFRVYEPIWRFATYSQHVSRRTFPIDSLSKQYNRPLTSQEVEIRLKLLAILQVEATQVELTDPGIPAGSIQHGYRARQLESTASPEIIDLLAPEPLSLSRYSDSAGLILPEHAETLNQCLMNYADECLVAGECDRALMACLTDLKFYRLFAEGGYYCEFGPVYLKPALEKLVVWCKHPQQTPKRIERGIQAVETELAMFPSARMEAFANYQSAAGQMDWMASAIDEGRVTDPLAKSFRLPTERARMRNLLFQKLALSDRILRESEEPRPYWQSASLWPVLAKYGELVSFDYQFYHYHQSSYGLLAEFGTASPGQHDLQPLIDSRKARLTRFDDALIGMTLLAYYKENGEFPSQYSQLSSKLKSDSLRKLQIGGYFSWILTAHGHWSLNGVPLTAP